MGLTMRSGRTTDCSDGEFAGQSPNSNRMAVEDHGASRPNDDSSNDDVQNPPVPAAGNDFARRLEARFAEALRSFDEDAARRLPTALREHLLLLVKNGGLDVGSDSLRVAAITGVCQQATIFSAHGAKAFETIGYEPLDEMDDATVDALVAGIRDLSQREDHAVSAVMYARTTPALLDGLLSYRGAADHLAHHTCFSFLLSLSCGGGTTSPDRAVAEALRDALPEPVLPVLN